MTPAVPVPDALVLISAGIVIVVIIAAIVFFWSRSRAGMTPPTGTEAARVKRLDYQPVARPVTPFIRPPVPRQPRSQTAPSVPVAVSVVDGRIDIADSTRALAEKYALTGFTLATADGLIFSTSGNPAAMEDAARYGGSPLHEGLQESAGLTIFTITHQGIGLTGLIRSEKRLTGDMVRRIESDTQEILNRWI